MVVGEKVSIAVGDTWQWVIGVMRLVLVFDRILMWRVCVDDVRWDGRVRQTFAKFES